MVWAYGSYGRYGQYIDRKIGNIVNPLMRKVANGKIYGNGTWNSKWEGDNYKPNLY